VILFLAVCLTFRGKYFMHIQLTKNTILPEMFNNPIEKNCRKKGKIDTPNTQINHRGFPGFIQELQSKLAGLRLMDY
jgi:hypothetical protein